MSPEIKTLLIECGDSRTRIVTVDSLTNLILRSTVIKQPVEHGWEREVPVHPALDGLSVRQIEGLGLGFLLNDDLGA